MNAEAGVAEVNGVWKWVAAILAAILMAGLPGYIQLLRGPDAAQVERINERQQLVLQRLAVVEQRIADLEDEQAEISDQIRELQEPIR